MKRHTMTRLIDWKNDPQRKPLVALELLKMGLAWHDPRYAPKRDDYAKAEADARKAKRGLWSDENPTPPWEWRKQNHQSGEDD